MLFRAHPRHLQKSRNISEKCNRANGTLFSESQPTSGIGTQPILICLYHGLVDKSCEGRSFIGHNVYRLCSIVQEDEEKLVVSLEGWKVFEDRGLKFSRKKRGNIFKLEELS